MNVIYMHSHDTGRSVPPYGHAVATPNIQWLAEEGVLYRQAFTVASTCSPSRACLLTGRHAHSCGQFGLANRGFNLRDTHKHLAHTLRQAGYTTALFGIQHLHTGPTLLIYDPNEAGNLANQAEYTPMLDEMRGRLNRWMVATDDPLLTGSVPVPETAIVNPCADIDPDEANDRAARSLWATRRKYDQLRDVP